MITRHQGNAPFGRSQSSSFHDLVWSVATADDEHLDLKAQTAQALAMLQQNLLDLGSDKSRIISAQVFMANIEDKPAMDQVWNEWIGDNPDQWPQRACVGVDLGGNWLIEITVLAAKK